MTGVSGVGATLVFPGDRSKVSVGKFVRTGRAPACRRGVAVFSRPVIIGSPEGKNLGLGCLGCCPRRCVDLRRRRLDHRLVIVCAEVPPVGRGLVVGAPPTAARVFGLLLYR